MPQKTTLFLRIQNFLAITVKSSTSIVSQHFTISKKTCWKSPQPLWHFCNLIVLAPYTSLKTEQSHTQCSTVSSSWRQIGHCEFSHTPLRQKLDLVESKLWHARQMNIFTIGRTFRRQHTFHTSLSSVILELLRLCLARQSSPKW